MPFKRDLATADTKHEWLPVNFQEKLKQPVTDHNFIKEERRDLYLFNEPEIGIREDQLFYLQSLL